MKKKILLLIKTVSMLLLLLSISYIPIELLGLDINKFSQTQKILYDFFMNIIFIVILFIAYRKTLIEDAKKFKNNFLGNIEYAFKWWLLGFGIMVVCNILMVFVSGFEIATNEQNIRKLISVAPIYMTFSIIIYAPFTEELIFRKGFKDLFKSKYLFIFMSGFTFAFLHVISSIQSPIDLLYLIPYSALGFVFSYLYYKTNNIFSSMTMHFLHNTLAILVYLIGGLIV
ncbi:MAG: type II CAAX endopeptidase family protein [bacterium]|nr:type II CAAX endopeptidase family protein [bacterium]